MKTNIRFGMKREDVYEECKKIVLEHFDNFDLDAARTLFDAFEQADTSAGNGGSSSASVFDRGFFAKVNIYHREFSLYRMTAIIE